LTLSPSAFGDDREAWAVAEMEVSAVAGDTVRMRRFADTLLAAVAAPLKATPDSYILHLYRGLALAYLGRRSTAVQEGETGLAEGLATKDEASSIVIARDRLAEIYVVVGDHAHAVAQLDSLLAKPITFEPGSHAWLTIDSRWAPLRGDPAFERLVAKR
jgi:hypothetical protein